MSVPADQMQGSQSQGNENSPTAIQALGQRLQGRFGEAEVERQMIETEWLKSLRQYKGLYESEVMENIQSGKSQAFIRLTRTKVKSTDARVMEMLFPAGTDKNWEIQPTPDPDYDPETKMQVAMEIATAKYQAMLAEMHSMDDATLQLAVAEGKYPSAPMIAQLDQIFASGDMQSLPPQFGPTDDEIRKAIRDDAKSRCEKMERVIDDQLLEARYSVVIRDVLHSGHMLGTGILKGPLVERKVRKKWVKDKEQGWVAGEQKEEFRPFAEFTPCWDVYPDQSVSDIDRCEYFFQRHVMHRNELRKLKNREDFDADEIERVIQMHPDGNAQYKNWEAQLRNISKDNNFKGHERRRHYEVLEFWGLLDGRDLNDCGLEVPEELLTQDIEVNAWVVAGVVIKLVLNPAETGYRPYHFYYFEKDDTSIWGIGIPDIYRWAQQICNASMRAALDNMGITAGPVYEVNLDLVEAGERIDAMFPFRIIYRRGKDVLAQYNAIKVHETNSRVDEFMKLFEAAKQLGDETTTLPSYTHGEQDNGVSRTVGGLSMLMGAATVTIKDVVRNFDDGITRPFLTALYDWNMQFNEDDSIKGDYNILARGSTSLVAKELYGNQLDNLAATTANDLDRPYVKRHELVRARFTARDLDPNKFVKTDKDVEDELRQEIQALQGQIEQMMKGGAPQQAAGALQ